MEQDGVRLREDPAIIQANRGHGSCRVDGEIFGSLSVALEDAHDLGAKRTLQLVEEQADLVTVL
jgi:hypothetical protein